MAIRNDIIKEIKKHLVATTSAWSASPGYLDDVNDFPSVSVFIPRETRYHIGSTDATIRQFTFQIRGYVFSSDSDSTIDSDLFAMEIEEALDLFLSVAPEDIKSSVFSTRVVSLGTDEGLLTPYGVCDLEVLVEYATFC